MPLFFLFNNLHFSLEILGGLVFLIMAWLAFDAFLIRKDFTTISRVIGFLFLAFWQVIHALYFPSEILNLLGYGAYFLGIFFILLNLLKESSVERPEFKAILLLPALKVLRGPFNIGLTIGLFLISLVAFRQYKRELKKSLLPFWLGFLFLTLAAAISIFYQPDSLGLLWLAGHLFQLIGFLALAKWVWSYLQLRIREELLLIFISFALLMAVIVSLTFSTILIKRMEAQTKVNLLTNARVLDLAILSLKEEALAKSKFLASQAALKKSLEENNFAELERLANQFLVEERLGFLIILDKEGRVILRAHALTKKDDNLSGERAVKMALEGKDFVTIESSPVEKFSIRAASPIRKEEEILAVIVVGFPLDNALSDSIKRITGLEMSIFEAEVQVATTALNPDGRTRSVGLKQTDPRVTEGVLIGGKEITLNTVILSRPFLASYLPIKNAEGENIGMISASQAQEEIWETASATNRLTLIIVIIIMISLVLPIYFLSQRLSEEMA